VDQNNVLVIGAGIGGIATAARLAQEGYQVTVLEKNESPGGRCGKMEIQSHRFDTGPTLFLMPELYTQAFADLGERIEDYLDLHRVDPTYQIRFSDGTNLVLSSDLNEMHSQLEAIEPGSFGGYLRYLEEGYRHYGASLDSVVRRDFRSPFDFFNLSNLLLILKLKALTKHYRNVGNYFKDERLKFAFIFQNLYMGIHPYRAPAIFSLMQFTELSHGVWFPKGGMYSIIEALVKIAEKNGVRFLYQTPVEEILVKDGKADGVRLMDGRQLPADLVIANADLPYVYQHLLPPEARTERFTRKNHGCSALVFFWGLDKQYPQLGPHNLFMAEDIRGGFDLIFDQLSLADEPSFYVHVPNRIDPSLAPAGHDTLSVAVPVAHLNERYPQDWEANKVKARQYILRRFEEIGISGLEEHLKFDISYSPVDWKGRYNLTKGSAHGLSHDLFQMGYLRPQHKNARYRNLYFVGASTHPGTGLPSVLVSAKHVSERIIKGEKVSQESKSLASVIPAWSEKG
jgi:phytoene desaturase